jgi:putative MATE family efflux protein
MRNLTEGNILRNILIYTWPVVLGDMLQSLYSTIDAVWVGHLIGPNALAAVSASTPIMFFLLSLIIGVAIATVIMVGQAYGMGDMDYLSQVIDNSFLTIIFLCVVFSAIGVVFAGPVLKLLNTPVELRHDATIFLTIIFAGIIFMFAQNWFSGLLRGMGDSFTPLILLAITVVINVILAPLLIAGIGPFPRLGIAGSALATVISEFITAIISFVYLARKNVMFNILKWKFRLNFNIIKKMFQIGIPVSLQMVIVSLSAVIVISLVNLFGPAVIAAYGIGLRIDQFSFLPAMSLGATASAFTAQAFGAKRTDLLPEILKWSCALSLCFAVFFFIIVNMFPAQISGIFTKDAAVGIHLSGYIRIVSFTYFAFAMVFAF